MPDHVHLLLEAGAEDSDLRRCQRKLKQLSGYYYKQQFKKSLWQRDGYEHVLRQNEATGAIIRYILENPLKAGLARSISDYPFVGSDVFGMAELLDFLQSGEAWQADVVDLPPS